MSPAHATLPRPRARGFTLIEMLVALSVSALLVTLVYGAVRIGQRSVQAVEQRVQDGEIMRIGWRFMHDAVSRTRSVPDPLDEENLSSFEGTADGLRLIADLPTYVGLGGLMRVTLSTENTRQGQQLVITRQRFDATDLEGRQSAEKAVLVEDLAALEIDYFGKDDPGEPALWRNFWRDPERLPELVRIQVRPNQAAAWPVMIAGPATGASAFGDADYIEDEELDGVDPNMHGDEH